MTVAYENLSENMKHFLTGLSAIHDFRHGFKESLEEEGGAERPVESGRKPAGRTSRDSNPSREWQEGNLC